MSDSDVLKEAMDIFRLCDERDRDNRDAFVEDVKFARLEEQWPDDAKKIRAGRPCLTVNKLAPIIRQVVNDARQNKPAITVRPQDSGSDVKTAEVFTGLIRNIENTSGADIAYDTAVENAVSGGFGYIRVKIEYSHDDTFDKDILIDRVANPLAVYGDPDSFSADGSDWNVAFLCDQLGEKAFEKQYPDAEPVSFEGGDVPDNWQDGDHITIAEYWRREQTEKEILLLSDGMTIGAEEYKAQKALFDALEVTVVTSRTVPSYKTIQRIITAKEVLETNEWAGCYIPIIPVYGDEVVLKNKRYLRSLIRSAIGAQQRYNYSISSATELAGLAPKVPYIGEEGAFDVDPNWSTANNESHPYLQYKKGALMPQRQPSAQISPAMMQEAMNAAEDIKAVTGIYDASLGARSNETSGVAINARKREGDVSTFHFIDNLTRSIRQVGRVLVDLIPKVYTEDRVVRVLGVDGKSKAITLGQETQEDDGTTRIYDLAAGKYDVAVKAGPSYTTQREETRAELVEIIKAVPESAQLLGPMYLRNSDWPGAEEAADLLEGKNGQQPQGVPPEQVAAMQQQFQELAQKAQQLEQENQQLKADRSLEQQKLMLVDVPKVQVEQMDAQTDAIRAQAEFVQARNQPATPSTGAGQA